MIKRYVCRFNKRINVMVQDDRKVHVHLRKLDIGQSTKHSQCAVLSVTVSVGSDPQETMYAT